MNEVFTPCLSAGGLATPICFAWTLLTATWVGPVLLALAFLWVAGFLFRSGWDSAGKKNGKTNT